MSDFWRRLKPYLTIALIGAFLGMVKGFKLGVQLNNDLLPQALRAVLEKPAVLYPLGVFLFFLLFIGLFLLLKTLGVSLGWGAFRAAGCGRNFLRVCFLLFIPAFLAVHLFAFSFLGREVTDDLVRLSLRSLLLYGVFWVLAGWWLRLIEQNARPLLNHVLLSFLLGILGGGLSLAFLVGFQVASENLFLIHAGYESLPASLAELGLLCLSYAGLFFFLFLVLSLLAGLFFLWPCSARRRLALGLGLLGVLAFSILFGGGVYLSAVSHGYGRGFLERAGIPCQTTVVKTHLWAEFRAYITCGSAEKPKGSRRVVLFWPVSDSAAAIGAIVKFEEPPRMSFSTVARFMPYWRTEETEATAENLQRIQQFVDNDYRTWGLKYPRRSEIWNRISRHYLSLWMPEEELAALHRLVTERGFLSQFYVVQEASRLSSAPITEENNHRLKELEERFKVPMFPRLQPSLARAWLHFGDLSKAKDYKERALRAGGYVRESAEKIVIPDEPPLSQGSIRGSIKYAGQPIAKGRIGLFTYSSPNCYLFTRDLVAARTIGPDGSFSFANLGGGEYYLALLTDSATLPEPVVSIQGNSGLIRLDHETSSVNLRPIELSYELPYDEAKVRYILAHLELVGSDAESAYRERRYNLNVLEAFRRVEQGVKVVNASDFEWRSLGWIVTRQGSEERISGRDVRLSTDR